jgi:ferredoxin-NADP reductase
VIYEDELGGDAVLTYTREAPDGWTGHTGHIDAELLREPAAGAQLAFVCGSNGFVETGSNLLLELGMDAETIRTERFGGTL